MTHCIVPQKQFVQWWLFGKTDWPNQIDNFTQWPTRWCQDFKRIELCKRTTIIYRGKSITIAVSMTAPKSNTRLIILFNSNRSMCSAVRCCVTRYLFFNDNQLRCVRLNQFKWHNCQFYTQSTLLNVCTIVHVMTTHIHGEITVHTKVI